MLSHDLLATLKTKSKPARTSKASKTMKVTNILLVTAIAASAVVANAQTCSCDAKSKGPNAAYSKKSIVETALGVPDLSTLITAVKAAGLVETLQGKGPFTVFAPLNSAFDKLPEGTVGTLVKPENKELLTKILTYHVVAGKVSAHTLVNLIKKGHGKASIKTVAGETLTATVEGKKVLLIDGKGSKIEVVKTDINCSNGVVHLLDGVLMPK